MELKKKVKSVGTYVKDHKVQFIVGGVTVVGAIVGGRYLVKHYRKAVQKEAATTVADMVNTIFSMEAKHYGAAPDALRKIDEEIFTDLAPEIEDMVMSKFVEDGFLERTYELGEGIAKKVTVTIKQCKL